MNNDCLEKQNKPNIALEMKQEKPNILIFMTDHQRADMAPPFKRATTPNLDAFYTDAIAFTRTYCPAPHCCPSRATFFSGLYPSQHGVWNNVNVGNSLSRGLTDGVRLWSEDLKAAGYHLYFSGKWHVSNEEGPEDRGFEVTYSDGQYTRTTGRPKPLVKEWKHYTEGVTCKVGVSDKAADGITCKVGIRDKADGTIDRPGYPPYHQYGLSDNPFKDTSKVESAIKSIMERKPSNSPWCHYVGTLGPHDPYDVPQEFLDMYRLEDIHLPENFYDDMMDKPAFYRRTKDIYSQLSDEEHKKSIQHYLAFCSYEDHLFGRLLQALKDTDALKNTIIVYTSDHGDYCGEHGLWAKGLPCFEGAYHVPLLVKHPKYTVRKADTSNPANEHNIDAFVSLADFAPTILEMAGVHTGRCFAGKSLMPFIKGEKPDEWRDTLFTQTNGNELYGIQRSVRTKEWKYVYNGFDYDELYNLIEDPYEMVNVIKTPDNKEVIKDMCKRMWQFAYENDDVCVNPYIMTAQVPFGPGIIFE